ncbi:uncharacterized protein LOC144108206 [Amblyomma americanum]
MRKNSGKPGPQDNPSAPPRKPEGEPARKDALEKSKISAVARQPEGKEEAGKALKGSSEKRHSVTVDSKPPRAKTSVGRDDWKASTTVAPMPQPFPLVESRRTVTAPQTAHDKPAGAEFRELPSVPSHQTDSGSSPQDLPPKPQEAAPTKPESAKAVRKSSKSSVGVVSTASGRHQASLLNAARRKSRVSRMSFKTTISGTAEPPQDLPGPAASARPAALPEVAPVAAQPELTKPSTSDKAPSCGIPGNQSLENPEGEITRKPSTAQLAQPTTSKVDGAEKSEKAFTGAAVEAVPDANQASQTGRASPKRSVSEKPADVGGERDHSFATAVSMPRDSRVSAASSKPSLKTIVPEKEIKPKGKVLMMPDGTYVGLKEKNRWIRAMHKEYLGWRFRTCVLKSGLAMMLLLFFYVLVFRQGEAATFQCNLLVIQ